ncbi:MAG: ABC transporter substrate-binding protein [Treponema sp.]|jgi:NitT/TauT family transport system substrate-binding protein|nr:ABC transporter substrate-binding protein [Treponema sp.]
MKSLKRTATFFRRYRFNILAFGLLSCFLGIFSATPLGALPRHDRSPAVPLRVGIMPDADSIPFMVARDEGLFEAEGVQVELISFLNPQERDAALQAGQLDASISDLLAAVFFAQGGFNFKVTSFTDGRYGIAGSPKLSITKLGDLRGKRIGLSTNTIIQYTVDAQLENSGLTMDAYQPVSVPRMPLRIEMILNGQIEAVSLPEPLLSAAVAQGANLLSTTSTVGIDAGVMLFSKEILDSRMDDVQHFYHAYYRAAQRINANPNDYRDYLVEKASFPAAVRDSYQFVTYRKPGLPETAQIDRVVKWLKDRQLLSIDTTALEIFAEDLVDRRIALAAAAW